VVLNPDEKEILFIECKWRDLNERDADKILADLKEKTSFVQWNKGDRKDYFGLAAKSIKGKERLRERGFVVFDLEDM